MAPANIGRQVSGVASDIGRLFREAATEYRAGAAAKEAEIRAALGE
jgi:hypothetical protein